MEAMEKIEKELREMGVICNCPKCGSEDVLSGSMNYNRNIMTCQKCKHRFVRPGIEGA